MKRLYHKDLDNPPNSSYLFWEDVIDYKNNALLNKFLSEQGKILSKRVTKLTSKQQRYMSKCIKAARVLAMLHFVSNES